MTENDRQGREYRVDFSGLVLGFSSAALSYMGVGDGGVGKPSKDLAKQNIEIIELLALKTKGNLTDEERRLTEQVLTDLKLKFAEVFKKT